ncbi:MAG TPA: MraY family glycosyltransferase [Bryobacteraceae bacterium]|nr:MraY family glycosyltransferase [Bryobacteraceae bacterium]
MYSLSILTTTAFLLSLLLTPLMRDWSIRLGLVDHPDQKRKLHAAATPRTGGVAILASYLGAYALLLLLPLNGSGFIEEHLAAVWRLMPPVAAIFVTGLLDDWLSLRPWQKLAGEAAAAVWAYAAGVRILAVGGHATTPWCSFLLTAAWLILCSNAFNLIDGIDGLAAGVGLAATLTTFVAGILHGDITLGLATAPLAGCLIGFLRYNFNPASIFLGDSGSLLIGFLLGSYAVIWSQKSATMLGVAAPAMALALPLLEVGLSILRRFLRNEPIFNGDRGHIHHRLLDRGFTPRRTALLLYGVCGLGATLSLVECVMRNRFAGVVVALFGAGAWIGVRFLGYVEFEAARSFLWRGLRPTLSGHVKLKLLERSLLSAANIEQCWLALERAARSLGYSHMNARLAGVPFATAPEHSPNGAFWQMRLNLPGKDYVNVTQRERSEERPVLLIPFVELVSRVLPGKLAQLEATQPVFRNSSTRTVMSSDCAAPSVNTATAS